MRFSGLILFIIVIVVILIILRLIYLFPFLFGVYLLYLLLSRGLRWPRGTYVFRDQPRSNPDNHQQDSKRPKAGQVIDADYTERDVKP